MSLNAEPLRLETVAAELQRLGVEPGSKLLIHSSLRSLGPLAGGAEMLIETVLDLIRPEGLLVMPTFTYASAAFDPASSPSKTGTLTEIMRQRPGVVRSLHPTHSVAALGRDAAALCSDHHLRPGLGIDSPLDRLASAGGLVLLLGVGHTSNSTVHVGEAHAQLPFLDIPFRPTNPRRATIFLDPAPIEVDLQDPPGCSRAFAAVEWHLRRRGAVKDGRIGSALVQLMPGREIIEATVDLLKEDPAALLCNDPNCYRCTQSRPRLGA